jgi:hypothetical protein
MPAIALAPYQVMAVIFRFPPYKLVNFKMRLLVFIFW